MIPKPQCNLGLLRSLVVLLLSVEAVGVLPWAVVQLKLAKPYEYRDIEDSKLPANLKFKKKFKLKKNTNWIYKRVEMK